MFDTLLNILIDLTLLNTPFVMISNLWKFFTPVLECDFSLEFEGLQVLQNFLIVQSIQNDFSRGVVWMVLILPLISGLFKGLWLRLLYRHLYVPLTKRIGKRLDGN